ncbi:hypothetical protein TNCV_884801 [Trichonephila clavipes]|nr:hypothetical protein TNCV_884801 [Trichonephila clavipes]
MQSMLTIEHRKNTVNSINTVALVLLAAIVEWSWWRAPVPQASTPEHTPLSARVLPIQAKNKAPRSERRRNPQFTIFQQSGTKEWCSVASPEAGLNSSGRSYLPD